MRHPLILAFLLIAGCREDLAEAPGPQPLTAEIIAHYCMMNISEHPGPKAQIFLEGLPDPIFFAQVRDAFSYIASADQDGYIAAIYVNDMSVAPWDTPGAGNWVSAEKMQFVVGSTRAGGMGAPELVPFSTAESAAQFMAEYGGRVYRLQDVPEDAYLAPVEIDIESLEQEEDG